jgi:hypothetical protein
VSGAAGAGGSGPRRLTAPPPDAVDRRSASDPAVHDGPCRSIAPRLRSRVAPARAFASPDAFSSQDHIERGGEPRIPVVYQELELLDAVARSIERVAGLLAHSRPGRVAVIPRMCTRRVASSITNSTYRRWSRAVSRWKQSTARMPSACVDRNCRHVSPARCGAGRLTAPPLRLRPPSLPGRGATRSAALR